MALEGVDAGPPAVQVAASFVLGAPASVRLGAVRAGDPLGAGVLSLEAVGGLGSSGEVAIEVEGPFEVVGSREALAPGEARGLEVRATGGLGQPRLLSGRARVEVDGQRAEVALSAAILDPKIPGVRWGHVGLGRQAVISMPSAPFPHSNGPYKDDSVLIFVPDHFTGREGVNVVLHAHGYHARVREVTPAHLLAEQVALSGRDVVLVAPQGPLMAADMALGKLDKRGGLKRLLEDVAAALYRDGLAPVPAVGEVVLTAHSGGYRGVANMLDAGGWPVKAVHLFDALYSRVSDFYLFGRRRGAVVRSSFTWKSATEDDNAVLARLLESNRVRVGELFTERELRRRRATVGIMRVPHDETMRVGQRYARLLATSGLPPSPLAPPVLIAAEREGDKARVRWWADPGAPTRRCVVEGSEDGRSWRALADVSEAARGGVEREALVAPMPWLRVRAVDSVAGESLASDRYGATGRRWLIVDGFDRAIDGQWPLLSHGFAAALGESLGEPFSVASHDAVAEGLVKLTDYARVLWFVGDEGQRDVVLDPFEWRLLDAYLDQGGRLIFSGADAAEGLRPDLLASLFGASLFDGDTPAARAAGRSIADLPALPGFERGADAFDALDGPDVIWDYDGHLGAAAVGRAGRVVLVGFGLERLSDADRAPALSELVNYLK